MSAVVKENKSLESASDKLPRACGRHYAVIQRLSVAEEVLPFPVDLGCSGTFIPAISYPENPGTPPILLQPPLGRSKGRCYETRLVCWLVLEKQEPLCMLGERFSGSDPALRV